MSRLVYRVLFEVSIRHAFYTEGVTDDFVVEPTAGCRALLSRHGLLFRQTDTRFSILARIDPKTTPDTLLQPLGDDTVVFRFALRLKNPYLVNITEEQAPSLGSTLLYFNNLREDVSEDRLHLGDSGILDGDDADAARIGSPVPLVAGPTYTHPFDPAVSSADVTLWDLFNNDRTPSDGSFSFDFGAGNDASEFKVDLRTVERITPGRYRMTDSEGGSATFYYDPDLFGRGVFGVIEIFSKTDTLTTDPTKTVPADYQFLDGNEVGRKNYIIQFEARSTTWEFVVKHQYNLDDGLVLNELEISGDISFTPTIDEATETVTFVSDIEVAFNESRQSLDLVRSVGDNGDLDTVQTLPNPGMQHVLQAGPVPSEFLARMFIYI